MLHVSAARAATSLGSTSLGSVNFFTLYEKKFGMAKPSNRIIRGFKYCIHPSEEQKVELNSILEDCRRIRNKVSKVMHTLIPRNQNWEDVFKLEDALKVAQGIKTQFFKTTRAPARSLTTAIEILYQLHKKAIKLRVKPPGYKHEESHLAVHYPHELYKLCGDHLTLSGITGDIRINLSRPMPDGKVHRVVVSRDISGRYFISFTICFVKQIEHGDKTIGLDLGVDDLVTTSEGVRFEAKLKATDVQLKLNWYFDLLRRKTVMSRSWKALKEKIRKYKTWVMNTRIEQFYEIATAVVKSASAISMERLNITKLLTQPRRAFQISHSGWNDLKRILVAKAEEAQIVIGFVGQYYPSTKTCSRCGYVLPKSLPLTIRSWQCLECSSIHDRDVNAAINIRDCLSSWIKRGVYKTQHKVVLLN